MLSEVIQLAHTDAHTHTHKIKMNKLLSIDISLSVWGLTSSQYNVLYNHNPQ